MLTLSVIAQEKKTIILLTTMSNHLLATTLATFRGEGDLKYLAFQFPPFHLLVSYL